MKPVSRMTATTPTTDSLVDLAYQKLRQRILAGRFLTTLFDIDLEEIGKGADRTEGEPVQLHQALRPSASACS